MKTQKMSLANIQGKLSRAEMKKIMAGSGTFCVSNPMECYRVGNTVYTCSVNWSGGQEECCCGHYLGDSNCEAT